MLLILGFLVWLNDEDALGSESHRFAASATLLQTVGFFERLYLGNSDQKVSSDTGTPIRRMSLRWFAALKCVLPRREPSTVHCARLMGSDSAVSRNSGRFPVRRNPLLHRTVRAANRVRTVRVTASRDCVTNFVC